MYYWTYGNCEIGLVKSYNQEGIVYTTNTAEAMKFATKSDLIETRLEIEGVNRQRIMHRSFFSADLKNLQDYFDFLAEAEKNAGKIYDDTDKTINEKINLLHNLAIECGLTVRELGNNAYWLGLIYDSKLVDCKREYYGSLDDCIGYLNFIR